MRMAYERLEGKNGHEAGRVLLARLYQEHFGTNLPEIAVTNQGKPYFTDGSAHFSISHTKDHVFCCLSDKNIGIDAEEMTRAVSPRLADKILSPVEKVRYLACEDKNEALLRLWVLKEAYAKLTGKGLGDYLYETDFDPNDPAVQTIDGCFVAILQEK